MGLGHGAARLGEHLGGKLLKGLARVVQRAAARIHPGELLDEAEVLRVELEINRGQCDPAVFHFGPLARIISSAAMYKLTGSTSSPASQLPSSSGATPQALASAASPPEISAASRSVRRYAASMRARRAASV